MSARGHNQPSPGRGRGGGRSGGVGMARGGPITKIQSARRPNCSIEVPQEFRCRITQGERQRLASELKEEGCEIFIHTLNETVVRFDLFGTGSRLQRTAQNIEQWISSSKSRSAESRSWAKIHAYDYIAWAQENDLKERDERTARFKGNMTKEEESEYTETAVVQWPQDLKDQIPSTMPKDVFGPTLGVEALNKIRVENEVFIRLTAIDRLEIRGSQLHNVQSAKQRLVTLIEKILHNQFSGHSEIVIVLDEREGSSVRFERAEPWWPDTQVHWITPRLLYDSAMPRGLFRQGAPDMKTQSSIVFELRRALETIRYEKGSHELFIHFGCLGCRPSKSKHTDLTDLIGSQHKEETFQKGLESGIMECAIKAWLFDNRYGKDLLTRLMKATNLLAPVKRAFSFGSGSVPNTLPNTQPWFRGTWVFKDPSPALSSSSGPLNYVVQLTWTLDEDGKYEKETPKFYRLRKGANSPHHNVDIKLLELGAKKGWQFNLVSMQPVSKVMVPAALMRFAGQVKINPKMSAHPDERFTVNDKVGGLSLQLLASRLDKIYTFDIKDTYYKANCMAMWYNTQPANAHPCWGLNITHEDWQTRLADLEHLPTGHAIQWEDINRAFLPPDGRSCIHIKDEEVEAAMSNLNIGDRKDHHVDEKDLDGIRLLLNRLMELSTLVNRSTSSNTQYPAPPVSSPTLLD